MTWPIAIFACFVCFVFSVIGFLTFVYVKEYNREEKLFKQINKNQEKLEKELSTLPIYIMAPPKKQTAPAPKTDAKKKNMN